MATITKLEIINNALNQLRLPKIESLADLPMANYPYNLLNELLNEAMLFLSLSYDIEYTLEDKTITFREYNKASLEDNKLFPSKITQMYYKKGTAFYYPVRVDAEHMKSYWNELARTEDVQNWSIIKDDIYIAPQPLETEIYIRHYKVLNFLTMATETVSKLPENYINIIEQYLVNCLSNLLGKETKDFYQIIEDQELNAVMTTENNYMAFKKMMPRNIRF